MSIVEGLLELLFPSRCLVCRRAGADVFCRECRASVRFLDEPLCGVCGIPVEEPGGVCVPCRESPPLFTAARGAAVYEGTLRKAIHALKYGGKRRMALPLGQIMASRFAALRVSPDVLLPVPLHPARERERGFNQAVLLAESLSELVGVSIEAGAVRKVRSSPSQRALTRQERMRNLHGAFTVAVPRRVEGRRVLLVDDVMTTGATFSEVAGALLEAGAAEVRCLCAARDLRRHSPR